MKRRFQIEVSATAVIEIDDEVLSSVDDEWRSQFYPLNSPAEIAQHLAYNLIVNGAELSNLDGFADKKDNAAKVLGLEWHVDAEEAT